VIHWYEEVGSTSDVAKELAEEGAAHGEVVVAEAQTAGRGRRGRGWSSPHGRNLYLSAVLRPELPPARAPELTLVASVALCQAVRQADVPASIKWPNDLLVGHRKLAGVLAESHSGPPASFVLVGCGLNVNQEADDLAVLGRAATSLQLESGRAIHRGELLVLCLERFEAWLALSLRERSEGLRREWERRLWGRGRRVRLRDRDLEITAVIEGIAPDASLLVRLDSGEPRRIIAGEIVL
jgi:BirA family biotin operon repressor/biotin-[acetyl-CoA-carboxylase] ligase